jgi:hypothetical protein
MEKQASKIIKVEYRIRKIERYAVTRWQEGEICGVETKGEYANPDVAFEVGYALCKAEHERMGWLPGDDRIRYPEHPIPGSMGPAIPA